MWEKLLLSLINKHRGITIGILIGLLASILFISYGFWKAIFIIICISLGYFIGRKIDEDKNLELWIKQLFKDKEQ